MNIILSDIMKKNDYNAGSKARNDVRDILSQKGFATHVVFNRNHNLFLKTIELIGSMKHLDSFVDAGDIIVLQYPYNIKIARRVTDFLVKIKQRKKVKLVYLLHDVYYIRGDQALEKDKLKSEEVYIFNHTDCLIVHNERMKAKLASDGVKTRMVSIKLFDYLTDTVPNEGFEHEGVVVDIAGNLAYEKSSYLYSLNKIKEVQFNLYGNGYNGDQHNVNYLGSFQPEQLVGSLVGDYGLVWDGQSINKCEGSYGNYLKYNNPHKMSLYLAANKPVIVWSESALAEFVKQKQIGICVSSLSELCSIPSRMTAEYQKMVENVKLISKKIRYGGFLLSALTEVQNVEDETEQRGSTECT